MTDTPGKERYVVYFVDDTIAPVGVLADDRNQALRVGQKARREPTMAAVSEDEGAADDLAGVPDDALSTIEHPTRWIEQRE